MFHKHSPLPCDLWAVDEDVDRAVAREQEVAQGDHHIQDEHSQIRDAEI